MDTDEFKLSNIAYGFIAGQLDHARGFSGSSQLQPLILTRGWYPGNEAPVYVGWAQTNRL